MMESRPDNSLEQQKSMAEQALREIASFRPNVTDLASLRLKLLEFNVTNGFYDAAQGKAIKGPFVNLFFKAVGSGAAGNWGVDKVSFGSPEKGIDCYLTITQSKLVLFYYEHANN